MYNGIGVPTARGTGTSGYVVKSLAHMKGSSRSTAHRHAAASTAPYEPHQVSFKTRKTSSLIFSHFSKREIDKKLLHYEDGLRLEAPHMSEEERQAMVEQERQRLVEEYRQHEHQRMQAKESEMSRKKVQLENFRDAFGIDHDVQEGRAFKFEELARDKDRRRLERQQRPALQYNPSP